MDCGRIRAYVSESVVVRKVEVALVAMGMVGCIQEMARPCVDVVEVFIAETAVTCVGMVVFHA